MSVQQTYRVRRNDSSERTYQLYELTWLWRTGDLPHDAVYQNEGGQWRPLSELLEPVLEARRAQEMASRSPAQSRITARWWWAMVVAGMAVAVALAAPEIQRQFNSWKAAKSEERAALEREQAARKEDFISSNLVVPGMTHEEVRRIVGPPRSIKATGDGGLERWIYRKQVIVFGDGKVIGIEGTK